VLRTVFFGTPEFAVPTLERLAGGAAEVLFAVTAPDKPVGRSGEPVPSAVARAAAARSIPVEKPERLRGNAEFLERLRAAEPDVAVVVAYGKILPDDILDAPILGSVNVHASLLPRHRGASPVQAALLAGDAETGVSTMRIVTELDAGPVYLERKTSIGSREDAGALSARLAILGADLLVETLRRLELSGEPAGTPPLEPRPQEGEATFSRVIRREDGEADWTLPAVELERRLRAFTPWPGLFTFLGSERIKIVAAEPGRSGLRGTPGDVREENGKAVVLAGGGSSLTVRELQREGKKPITGAQFLAGLRGPARFGPRRG
jgi:methionyl-tRNA formyltransferase